MIKNSMQVYCVEQSRGGTEISLNLILGTPEGGIAVGRDIAAGSLGIHVPSPPGPFPTRPPSSGPNVRKAKKAQLQNTFKPAV